MKPPLRALLTLNAGSSSLRFALFAVEGGGEVLGGKFDQLGGRHAQLSLNDEKKSRSVSAASPRDCLPALLNLLTERGVGPPEIIAHRVVHGGPRHFDPVEVTPKLIAEFETLRAFAPNHLPIVIELLRATWRQWPKVRQIACFDTAFHRDLPAAARLLPIPRRYAAQGVRRYGFHGLAYTSVVTELRRRTRGRLPARVVLAHLGHGASLAAVAKGRCVDTTMGFTPIGGIVMSTRSGDLDPGVLTFIAGQDRLTPTKLEAMMSSHSGLLGLSETSDDTRELLKRESRDTRAAEALAVFVQQARKAIGGFIAVLGGLDALVFSGGIGENSAELRARICANFDYVGLRLARARNASSAAIISPPGAAVTVHVIKADEESTLAQAARTFLSAHS